jgi:gp16 family phage-associated protein
MKGKKTMNGEEVKRKLRARGITLTAWAKENNFPYPIVSGVIRGVIKGNFGVGHEVAVKLGLKEAA